MFVLESADLILKAFWIQNLFCNSGTLDSENCENITYCTGKALTRVGSFLSNFSCWIDMLRQFELLVIQMVRQTQLLKCNLLPKMIAFGVKPLVV